MQLISFPSGVGDVSYSGTLIFHPEAPDHSPARSAILSLHSEQREAEGIRPRPYPAGQSSTDDCGDPDSGVCFPSWNPWGSRTI